MEEGIMGIFPSFYKPGDVSRLYKPRRELVIAEALADRQKVIGVDQSSANRWTAMVAIDAEVGFALQGVPLKVQGAIADIRRAIELIYQRPDLFDEVFFTLDQHFSLSIYFRWWWINDKNEHPQPFTKITAADVDNGVWKPIIMEEWSKHVVHTLGEIEIWPLHCDVGSDEARLVPALEEAIIWLAVVRNSKAIMMLKGDVVEADSLGVFGPDIQIPGHPRGGLMREALNLIGRYRRTYWWGEAGNFCLMRSIMQFVEYFAGRSSVLEGIYFIKDCTSLIGTDLTEYNRLLGVLQDKGAHIVTAEELLHLAA
jgi:nicotinamidase/pyrazinamidase